MKDPYELRVKIQYWLNKANYEKSRGENFDARTYYEKAKALEKELHKLLGI